MNQTANFDPLIRKMARRMARSLPTSDTADDLAQVGRLAVERAIPDWDGRRLAMPTFVRIVASRRMAVFARVERRRGIVRVGDVGRRKAKPPTFDSSEAAEAGRECDARERWSRERRNSVLACLDRRSRLVVLLRFWRGMSPREIGERLGVTRQAVERALRKALKTLAEAHADLRDEL